MRLLPGRSAVPGAIAVSARTRPGVSVEGRACYRFFLVWLIACCCHAQSVKLLVQSSPLAGFQYYAGAVRWDEMKVGDTLVLVREPDNGHDENAVRVEWHGEKLGYLPRKENRAVAMELDRGGRVEARIARLQQHRNPWQRVLIDVFVTL